MIASTMSVFGHLAGEAFDHQHRVARAGDDQVELAGLQLVLRRERDELAVDQAQPHRAERALERQRRNAQRRGGAVHRQHVAVGLPIAGQHEALDLHFVVEAFGNSGRIGRSMSRDGERFLGRRPAFALEEAAGELAGRGVPLAVVAGEREEIDARPRRARRPRR